MKISVIAIGALCLTAAAAPSHGAEPAAEAITGQTPFYQALSGFFKELPPQLGNIAASFLQAPAIEPDILKAMLIQLSALGSKNPHAPDWTSSRPRYDYADHIRYAAWHAQKNLEGGHWNESFYQAHRLDVLRTLLEPALSPAAAARLNEACRIAHGRFTEISQAELDRLRRNDANLWNLPPATYERLAVVLDPNAPTKTKGSNRKKTGQNWGLRPYSSRKKISTPLEGIRLFERVDQEKRLAFEDGSFGSNVYRLGQYWPRTGEFEFQLTLKNPLDNRVLQRKWSYNQNSGSARFDKDDGGRTGWPTTDQWAVIAKDLKIFAERLGIPQSDPSKPAGYEGLQRIIEHILKQPADRPESIQPGDFVLFESERDLVLTKFSRMVMYIPTSGDYQHPHYTIYSSGWNELGGNGLRFYHLRGNIWRVDEVKYFEITGKDENVGDFRPYGQVHLGKSIQSGQWIRKLSAADAKILASYRPRTTDIIAGTNWSRELLTLYASLMNLQYERWGADEINVEARGDAERLQKLKTRYAGVTPKNYGKALDMLIRRFGEENFYAAAEYIFEAQLSTLHTKKHTPNTPYGPHSDSGPLPMEYSFLASDAVQGIHPVPKNMNESGYLVNFKTLMGDKDFWIYLKARRPKLFDRLVDYVKSLPRDFERKNFSGHTRIDPIAVMKQYFPDAFGVIHSARPDFDSDAVEAIRLL